MPVYPCARCGGPVDPTTDLFCKACSDKLPYECSRCNKRMSSDDVFQLEKLKTKRPLLCMTCGESGEVVKCKICKLSLVRASGTTLSSTLGAPVYHQACVDRQFKTVAWVKKMIPMLSILGFLVGWLMGQNVLTGVVAAVPAAFAGAAVFGAATYFLAILFTPK